MRPAFAVERVRDCWQEVLGLAAAHWRETEAYRAGEGFRPIFERYTQYEWTGNFVLFMARDGLKRAVGYAGIYIMPSMHTQQIIATEDTFFLVQEARQGRNAMRFCRFVENEARRRGAITMAMTAKDERVGQLLLHLGYVEVARHYSKSLTSGADSPPTPVRVMETA